MLPPGGCLDVVHRRHTNSILTQNGDEIPYDLAEATVGDPEANRLGVRAENERRAGIGFGVAAAALLLGGVVSGEVGSDRSKQVTAPTLFASGALSIGIGLALVLIGNHTRQAAIDRYNRDAGCR